MHYAVECIPVVQSKYTQTTANEGHGYSWSPVPVGLPALPRNPIWSTAHVEENTTIATSKVSKDIHDLRTEIVVRRNKYPFD